MRNLGMALSEALQRAFAAHQARHLAEAERMYKRIIRAEPGCFDALHLLGVLKAESGFREEAERLLAKALTINPRSPEALNNVANVLCDLKRYEEALACCERALALRPDFAEALNNRGNALHDLRRYQEALASYDRALAIRTDYAKALANRANALRDLKRYEEALASCDRALALVPDFAEALNNRASVLHRAKRYEEALACYDKVLASRPSYAKALANRAGVLRDLKRYDEARASCDQALAIDPASAEALGNRGSVLRSLKRYEDALECYNQALAIEPDNADALNDRASALCELKRYDEALASCERALTIRRDYAEAFCTRGVVLHELKRHEEALASFERALALEPDLAEALNNQGIALQDLNRLEEALMRYDRALVLDPNYVLALKNRGGVLRVLNRVNEALACYNRALSLEPDNVEVLNKRGNLLQDLRRWEEAARDYECALNIDPDSTHPKGMLHHSRMWCCDWRSFEEMVARLHSDIRAEIRSNFPFAGLSYLNSAKDAVQCARIWARELFPPTPQPIWTGERYEHDRIRVAYLSPDLRQHPVGYFIVDLIERHDRGRFETIALSLYQDRPSEIRARLKNAFERFIEVEETTTDREVAQQMRELEIDIAVDCAGYTARARTGIFALRPAPIQVSYLGYPGTMGAEYIDYILADRVVIPEEHFPSYSEKVVHLPDSYQANDSTRRVAEHTPARPELGLPEHGFVFCCFNNSFKITPQVFEVWMGLLRDVEDSVLWLLESNAAAADNLRREARQRGVLPERLVFAPLRPVQEHLARQRAANLFLDTLPYNAHTTASDALRAGLPVVTCLGTTFASRVAASLLYAVGLPELVTHSLADYAALARKLAIEPASLAAVRAKLERNCSTYPLFDTDRFRRHIERAYEAMWARHRRGEPPAHFAVEALDR